MGFVDKLETITFPIIVDLQMDVLNVLMMAFDVPDMSDGHVGQTGLCRP